MSATSSTPSTGPTEELLTSGEVARRFGVKVSTVTRWANSGRIPALSTVGGHKRFRRSDVDRLLGIDAPRDGGIEESGR